MSVRATRTTLGACLLLLAAACGGGVPEDRGVVRREGKTDVVRVEADDPEMNRAIAEARRTMPQFLAALRAAKQTRDGFGVKYPFREGEQVEHMWVRELGYDGQLLRGLLNSDPQSLQNYRLGQPVEVAPDAVSDWMYIEDGKLVGGYTMRVMARRYTPEEKRVLEEELGFRIE